MVQCGEGTQSSDFRSLRGDDSSASFFHSSVDMPSALEGECQERWIVHRLKSRYASSRYGTPNSGVMITGTAFISAPPSKLARPIQPSR